MIKHIPLLSTFVSSNDMVHAVLSSGAQHLILEDAKLSIRSHHYDDFKCSHFHKLHKLAIAARRDNPTIELSVQCDILFHHRHVDLLSSFIDTLKKASLTTIRIQDPGLIPFFNIHYPEATLHFVQELGNQNYKSIAHYATFCSQQLFSPELPISNLLDIQNQIPNTHFDIQVHGPLLIQHAYRRYLSGRFKDKKPYHFLAQDTQYPNRHFTFHETLHGHFMYLYFDRCLLKYIHDLMSLSLRSWVIDARGYSLDYLQKTLCIYREERDLYLTNPTQWTYSKIHFATLQQLSPRPLKAGFFRANKTDQVRQNNTPDIPSHYDGVGLVVDSIKEGWFTIDCLSPIQGSDHLLIVSPKGDHIQLQATTLRSLQGQAIKKSKPYSLVQLKWHKGIHPKSKVYKLKESPQGLTSL